MRLMPIDGPISIVDASPQRTVATMTQSLRLSLPDDRFRILFEHSSDAHLIFDETGITDCNEACVKLLRATDKAQVLAHHPAALSPKYQPDGRLSMEKRKEMDFLAQSRGYHRFEWMHQKLDGEVFPVEVTLNPVVIGAKPAMIVVWHDLTELKRVEARLRRQSEELESLNRELTATNVRLKRDLEAAARIQQALLPAAVPIRRRCTSPGHSVLVKNWRAIC
jgi:PAS domain S-box-containing protein